MIYPKCYSGTMSPFISNEGFLFPCCQLNYTSLMNKIQLTDETYDDNPFINNNFSLYNKRYAEIVESVEWNNLIDNLHTTKLKKCWKFCGSKQSPRTSPMIKYDPNFVYEDKKFHTKDFNTIQIETSNRCSLKCGYCARVNQNRLNNIDISLDVLKDVFQYKFWDSIVDCGSLSDPIFYKHYHEMLILLNQHTVKHYRVSIAATGKTEKWWNKTQNLWKELRQSGIHVIVFWGIDGLEDTSKIHRINQDWNEITNNMKTAAKNGIECFWQFIPMRFNEHQITEARQLAKDWGVKFYLKPSDRFSKEDKLKPLNKDYFFEVEIANNISITTNLPKGNHIK